MISPKSIVQFAILYIMVYNQHMNWDVQFTSKSVKQLNKLGKKVILATQLLVNDLETYGPNPGKRWHNYGKLYTKAQQNKRHCHLLKGNPTYVCCWIVHKEMKLIEVYYVGTHEKAPY